MLTSRCTDAILFWTSVELDCSHFASVSNAAIVRHFAIGIGKLGYMNTPQQLFGRRGGTIKNEATSTSVHRMDGRMFHHDNYRLAASSDTNLRVRAQRRGERSLSGGTYTRWPLLFNRTNLPSSLAARLRCSTQGKSQVRSLTSAYTSAVTMLAAMRGIAHGSPSRLRDQSTRSDGHSSSMICVRRIRRL